MDRFGSAGRVRTCDILVNSEALYQLSYSRKLLVRDEGFEPSASAVQVRRSNQAELTPDERDGRQVGAKRFLLYLLSYAAIVGGSDGTRTRDLAINSRCSSAGIRPTLLFVFVLATRW